MISLLINFSRYCLLHIGRLLTKLILRVTMEGQAQLPDAPEPLILIANHFSWFDAPILALLLPFQPAFLVATEAQQKWWVQIFLRLFDSIPIWRGQVDREAFRQAQQRLAAGQVIGLFPEGGINPELVALIARGKTIPDVRGNASRLSAQLMRPRPGSALLAVMSQARILPVALIGTEQILGNLRQGRRTSIIVRIGPAFGPLQIEPELTGRARRQRLDELADRMMHQIAQLFPPENRGDYAQAHPAIPDMIAAIEDMG